MHFRSSQKILFLFRYNMAVPSFLWKVGALWGGCWHWESSWWGLLCKRRIRWSHTLWVVQQEGMECDFTSDMCWIKQPPPPTPPKTHEKYFCYTHKEKCYQYSELMLHIRGWGSAHIENKKCGMVWSVLSGKCWRWEVFLCPLYNTRAQPMFFCVPFSPKGLLYHLFCRVL